MIYEFALDPSLVVDWAVAGAGRFVGQFGIDQRRLVSDFPRDWQGAVSGAFYKHFDYDDSTLEFQNAQPLLSAYMQVLNDYVVARPVAFGDEKDWLTEAIAEHARRPFHAIMVANRVGAEPQVVITPTILDEIRDERWYLPTVVSSKKTAGEIAAALSPMLSKARRIVLVDPYFNASKPRYTTSFAEIMKVIFSTADRVAQPPEITILTGVQQSHKPSEGDFTPQQKASVANDLCGKAISALPRLMPKGVRVTFSCLQNPAFGDPLHNRFVLTEIGGVVVPYGLDDYDSEVAHDAKDDIQPMLKGIYEGRWRQYGEGKGVDLVGSPISIDGAG